MRVAYLNQDPGIAPRKRKGAAVHVASLVRALREVGCEVVEVHAKDGDGALDELARAHEREPLDLVYERYALGAAAGARFGGASGVPLFLEVNAPLIDEARDARGVRSTPDDVEIERRVFAAAETVFAVSSGVADYVARHGLDRARIRLVPNAVDAALFRPDRRSRHGLALSPQTLVIGFHGRLRPWHNFALLGEAVERLARRTYPVHVVAIGEGDFAAEFPGALARSHLTSLPWMEAERLAAHVARFDVIALTYAAERPCYFSPLKLLEGMAAGAVPVVPDLGDLPEAVEHGACGVVYAAGDACALADAIAGLVDWPDVRARLRARAIARARSHTWIDVAREIVDLAKGARRR